MIKINEKREALRKSASELKNLTPVEQEEIGKYVEEILSTCKNIKSKDLSNIINVLIKMAKSARKYDINSKGSDAYSVLNELYCRLELIEKLESSLKNSQITEIKQLFKQGLWILHPRYEGQTRFTLNQEFEEDFSNLKYQEISAFRSNHYSDDSEVIDGFDELLVIQLKHTDSKITSKDKYQALEYAKEIIKKGDNSENTAINVYVLGTAIDYIEKNPLKEGNIKIIAKQYDLLIKTAKNRTLNLVDKIRDANSITEIGDSDIREILKEENIKSSHE